MATVTNKRKVLSVKENVKVIREIESVKKKADVCREFGLVNSTVQTIWKNETELSALLNKMDHELSDYESLNEVTLMKRC
jgi:inactivated superfamily I helicase